MEVNNTPNMRVATLTVGGQVHTVRQAGNPNAVGCEYSVSPSGRSFDSAGGTGTVTVSASSGCSWTASSNNSWINVISGKTGSGGGTVTYLVYNNPSSSSRTGTVSIAGQTHTVTQAGYQTSGGGGGGGGGTTSGCSYTVSDYPVVFVGKLTKYVSFGYQGGERTLDVRTDSSCDWEAVTDADWVEFPSGASGSGNGQLVYEVVENPTNVSRETELTLGGSTITLHQDANPNGGSGGGGGGGGGGGSVIKALFFPHVGANAGWTMTLVVANPNNVPLVGEMATYTDNGLPGGMSVPMTIPAHGSYRINVGETFGTTGYNYLVFETESEGLEIKGFAEYNVPGLGRVTIPMSDTLTEGLIVIPAINCWSGLALVNASDVPTVVSFAAYNADGGLLGQGSVSLQAGQQWLGVIDIIFPGADLTGAVTLEYSSPNPVSMLLINGSYDNTLLDGLPG